MIRPALIAAALIAAPAFAQAAPPLTVVELFQSQGCSSCPPANAAVNALIASRPDVLALSFAVTYWDRLGWKDRFATPEYTQRQWAYAKGLRHDNVYTPQVIVNGRADTTGTRDGQITKLIAGTARVAGPALNVAPGALTVAAAKVAAPADVWLVRYDPRTVEVAIKAGENEGRTLPHRNIVRQLTRLGAWTGKAQSYKVAPAPAGLSTAFLVQAPNGGPILAAARG